MIGALPNWPAMMATDMAAAYVSMSESGFQALAAANGVRPVDLGGLRGVRWKKGDVDRLVDTLPPRDGVSRASGALAAHTAADARLAQEALSRVGSRSARRRAR